MAPERIVLISELDDASASHSNALNSGNTSPVNASGSFAVLRMTDFLSSKNEGPPKAGDPGERFTKWRPCTGGGLAANTWHAVASLADRP